MLLLGLFAGGCVGGEAVESTSARIESGKQLFEDETFGGNGRTCSSCHSRKTGTQTLTQISNLDEGDSLFVGDGSDDGLGNGETRMRAHGTVIMQVPITAPNVWLTNDPTNRIVTLRRGIPTTMNTPALDPVLMLDGRAPTLQVQALGAIHDHAASTVEPTAAQLDAIVAFQQGKRRFFSSCNVRDFARGGAPPELPAGNTESEIRGRRHFLPDGVCGQCHSGPLLNQTSAFFAPNEVFGAGHPLHTPVGSRFAHVDVSEQNRLQNPVQSFSVQHPNGTVFVIQSADPGRLLQTGSLKGPLAGPPAFLFTDINVFKINPLWGISRTAPYFHDSSANTLQEVVEHYNDFFTNPNQQNQIMLRRMGPECADQALGVPLNPACVPTEQDLTDMVAFMMLLDPLSSEDEDGDNIEDAGDDENDCE